jgi:hypothetical protein
VIYSRFEQNRQPRNTFADNCLHLRYIGLNRIVLEPALQQQENFM